MSKTNHETNLVILWIDNSESTHKYWVERARVIYNSVTATSTFSKRENASFDLADAMKDKITNEMYDMLDNHNISGLWSDMLCSAISDVNWYYVADLYIDNFVSEESVGR
jgi:hypothetical protein